MAADRKDTAGHADASEAESAPGREERPPRSERRPSSLRGLARRLLFDDAPADGADRPSDDGPDADSDADPDENRRRLEARAVLAALLETGDKAKTETIRMVAREVRGYLEALELGKDINHLLTNYSLEVKASVHLEPLPRDEAGKIIGDNTANVGLKRKDTAGKGTGDTDSGGTDRGGKDTAGKDTGGKNTAGKDTGGKNTGGKNTAGKKTASKDSGDDPE